MQSYLTCMFMLVATMAHAQGCFVENLPKPIDAPKYDAKMRALMMAHSPIEYRNSCGLRDETDQQFFDAIRAQVGCSTSSPYQEFFGHYLQDQENYLFAVKITDLRTDEAFANYCRIVERIDLGVAVNDDGSMNVELLQSQAPLFHAISTLVSENSIK